MNRPTLSALAVLACGIVLGSWITGATAAPRSPIQETGDAEAQPEETDRERLERKIRKLLKENGTESSQKRSVEDMVDTFEEMGLPVEFGEKFVARFDVDHLIDLCVDIYADHLDEPTVDAQLVFWATPAGRKAAEAAPEMNAAMMRAGMEYGQEIGAEVAADLDK